MATFQQHLVVSQNMTDGRAAIVHNIIFLIVITLYTELWIGGVEENSLSPKYCKLKGKIQEESMLYV